MRSTNYNVLNWKVIVSFFMMFSVLYSCQKKPSASISANKTTVKVDESVYFSNSTTNAHSYEWDFGDGQSSTLEFPIHSWSQAGTYTVRMKAFSKNGKKSDEASIIITVTEPENAKFLGTYIVQENYVSDYCGTGTDSYTMTIRAGNADNEVYIDGLAGGINNVLATVSGNNLTIPPQYGMYDIDGFLWDISYLGNSYATLYGNALDLTYVIDDYAYTPNGCGEVDGFCTATK